MIKVLNAKDNEAIEVWGSGNARETSSILMTWLM